MKRRTILTSSLTLPYFCSHLSAQTQKASSNDRIQVAVIGCGSRGFNLIDSIIRKDQARIVAICDVDEVHYRDKDWGKGTKFGREGATERISKAYQSRKSDSSDVSLDVYSDFRDVTSRDDIDAVVVATPDHWHAAITLAAIDAGKDVYCEKPVTHLFAEGMLVRQAVEKNKVVFQTGSQQRSLPRFQTAVEIVRNGLIGNVQTMQIGLPPGYAVPQGDDQIKSPPKTLDYDFWCGPATKLPYMRARHHRWWRGSRAYGGGVLMDWIGHHNDIAHWMIDTDRHGPIRIESMGWKLPQCDCYDTPQQYTIACQYEGGIKSRISSEFDEGLRVIADDGWVFVNRSKIEVSDKRLLDQSFALRNWKATLHPEDDHVDDFLRCVRSRHECRSPVDITHRSITPGHVGYVSDSLNRSIAWDPSSQEAIHDNVANELLNKVHYRKPWNFQS